MTVKSNSLSHLLTFNFTAVHFGHFIILTTSVRLVSDVISLFSIFIIISCACMPTLAAGDHFSGLTIVTSHFLFFSRYAHIHSNSQLISSLNCFASSGRKNSVYGSFIDFTIHLIAQ
ncbi:MAG: hypothetical protein WCG25_04280 [bacterium]